MNKILITNKNIPYDNTYKNVFHFASEVERDTYIETNIHPNFKIDLDNQKEVNFIPTSSLNATVELGFSNPDMLERNYAIVLKGNKRIFYFINRFSISKSNERVYTLELEYDIFMNRYNLMDSISKFNLIRGHSDNVNYLENTYDLENKIVKTNTQIDTTFDFTGNIFYSKAYLWVMRKANTSNSFKRLNKIINGIKITEPYILYFAPLLDLPYGPNPDWEEARDDLFRKMNIEDGTIIKSGVTISQPLYFTFDEAAGVDLINLKKVLTGDVNGYDDLSLYYVTEIDYDTRYFEQNIREIDFSTLTNIEKVKGIFKYDLILEGTKTFEIETKAIENNKYKFVHYDGFNIDGTQNIKFIHSIYKDLINENNTWVNEKEFVRATNSFNELGSSSPISTALAPLKDLGKVVSTGLKASIFGAGAAGAGAGLIGVGNNIIGRQDIKRKPNEVTSGINPFNDFVTNDNNSNFSLIEYEYIGKSRDFVIEDIKRNGITYNLGNYITSYTDIKRPVFNFIQSLEISNDKINIDTSKEIKDTIANVIANGITLWNDYTKYLDFTADNGDE